MAESLPVVPLTSPWNANIAENLLTYAPAVNLNHFRLLRVVGKGAFGKVRIVERKDTGLTFALKYIRKDEVVRSESVRNIIRERRMLEHLNHPFLCNLRYSFQDIEYLYIVVDLMTGGDLRFHISRKAFTEDAVRFWIAQLGCAVRYIHQQGIVHRDIKPDNVLLDCDGHVHLADFNVASDFIPHKPLTSKSGTLAYLAPEVYEGKGYSCEVDWWSLGVLFYECIYNKRPFEASSHDSLAQKIIKGEPTFPVTTPPVTMPCLHAISSLLEKNRKKRIGAIGFETFVDNPFFRPLDFSALERKEIDPVFIPSSDKTNFDATYDLEELLLEEAPLEARARRQKPREALKDDATDQEVRAEELHKMIETLFEPFNYMTMTEQRPAAILVTAQTCQQSVQSNPGPRIEWIDKKSLLDWIEWIV
ncbi:kinase C-like protein [Massariosphaeria phaeospora]|uniref:non-specific serine/threonine protein kinase n=1 Tax=Massariosphaeria phaeospora TaxID=100035 RepID=A0A7C8I1X6_9PLEO|nr:kinase C-like protein [Massariosphaeria phaeospora]